MRKMLLAGLAALLMLLVLPGAVSAALEDTVVVSGSIGANIAITVTPDTPISWGAMSGTKTDLTSADLSVVTTYAKWHVDAADAKITDKGYMVDTTAGKLTLPFQLSNNGGTGWTAMTGTFTNFAQKASGGAGTWPFDIGLQQVIDAGDESGDAFTITITFTATPN